MILKNTNYLFIDGRYTLLAKKECGTIALEIPHTWPKDVYKISNLKIGFDPKLFTENTLQNISQIKQGWYQLNTILRIK